MKKYFFILISLVLIYSCGTEEKTYSEDDFITKAEETGFTETADYEETMEYFRKLDEASGNNSKMIKIGVSPQGRDLNCFIAAKGGEFTPAKARNAGKPVMLVINGIHSGEIMGKDASAILLRKILITKEKESLLDSVVLLVIPIFNVDGHERSSKYNRINQNGPNEKGWRYTAQNLNLNRDFTKADAPEMKAFLELYNEWLPDFLIDNHSTNGADYQYTITYAISKSLDVPPSIRNWVRNEFVPFVEKGTEEKGFLISPYVEYRKRDLNNGIEDWMPMPRFSNGYTSIQNRPGLLIETHAIKPYKDRTLSTVAVMESVLELINKDPKKLIEINLEADKYVINHYVEEGNAYPVSFEITDKSDPFLYKGKEYDTRYSIITGNEMNFLSDKTFEKEVPYYSYAKVTDSIYIPKAYIIPQEWMDVIDVLKLHGVKMEQLGSETDFTVEKYKFSDVKFRNTPYEGRFIPSYTFKIFEEVITANEGDYIIYPDQRAIGAAVNLLEPKYEDSFVKWGFFNTIFQYGEYFSPYKMEPVAKKMMEENPDLREEFEQKLTEDESFRNNYWRRLYFFYERSPYYDEKYNVYPVMRVIN